LRPVKNRGIVLLRVYAKLSSSEAYFSSELFTTNCLAAGLCPNPEGGEGKMGGKLELEPDFDSRFGGIEATGFRSASGRRHVAP